MSDLSRRNWIRAGVGAAAGAVGVAAGVHVAGERGLLPPGGTGIWAPGEALTFAAQRAIGTGALAREFGPDQISRPPYANGRPPKDEAYVKSQAEGFAGWRLRVEGMVDRPAEFSVADLKAMPSRSQITHLACEEGWSFIAEWTGVPMAHVLETVGASPRAKYVFYHSIQPRWWDSVDMGDALHPQTVIAHGMNGGDLPPGHGGPLRVRVPRQLGYKSVKYVTRLTVTDTVKAFGKGMGSYAAERGYAWYSGI